MYPNADVPSRSILSHKMICLFVIPVDHPLSDQNTMWNMFEVNNKNTNQNDVIDVFLLFLVLTLNLFHTFILVCQL